MSLRPSLAQAAPAYAPSFAYEHNHQSIAIASDGGYRFTKDWICAVSVTQHDGRHSLQRCSGISGRRWFIDEEGVD